MQIVIVLALGLAIVAAVFAFQNPALVTVNLFAWTFEGSLALVLLITFAAGFLTSLIFSFPTFLKYNLKLSAEKHRTKNSELQQPSSKL